MRVFRNSNYVFLICLLCFGFAVAQDNSKKKDRSNPHLPDRPVEVKANVKVVDAAGIPINDLKQENIRVFEDGVEQKITYFVRKDPVLNLGLVIDNTGSMRTQLKEFAIAGGNLVDALAGKDEAFLIRFVSSDKIELIRDWTAEKNKLKTGLAEMYVEGGQSAVIDALYVAAKKTLEHEKINPTGRHAIVLISDGEERDSFYDLGEMLTLFKNTDLQIFVIGVTAELLKNSPHKGTPKHPKQFSENLTHLLALETGGTAYVLSTKYTGDDLANVTKSIVDELRYQYVIGYTSTNKKRDGLARKLRVEVADGEKGEKRQGIIRESFVVPKEKS